LEADVNAAQKQVDQSTIAQEAALASQEEAQAFYNAARQRVSEAEVVHRSTQAEYARIERAQSERQNQFDTLKAEKSALELLIRNLDSQQQDLFGAIEAAQEAQMACEERLNVDQSALVEEEATAKDLRQRAVVVKTELAGVEQRLQGLARIVNAAKQTEDSAARQVMTCEKDIAQAKERISDLASDERRLVDNLAEITESQGTLRIKIDALKTQISEARETLRAAEEAVRGLRDERESATAERMELERSLDQIKVEIAQIRAQLDERYQISVTGLLDRLERNGQVMVEVPTEARGVVVETEDAPDEVSESERDDELEDLCIKPSMLENVTLIGQWVERLSEAKRRLDRLGEVNLVAVQEYAEVKSRHDTLDAQRADLEESVRGIRNTIAQLNRTCRERFRETFDRVNVLFQDGYPKLVGGGRARLVLTDDEDMLETGVDIEVQPPGKRLQNLSLLSGGEMAMTAIALIFALFQVKPSPFCLLDEVDAPLDEANGARFNNLLREMAKLSQFIVITHNKKTMECVDTLYGVTMPNAGVSQLVSVKLD
jgi:chromosome segregation protein